MVFGRKLDFGRQKKIFFFEIGVLNSMYMYQGLVFFSYIALIAFTSPSHHHTLTGAVNAEFGSSSITHLVVSNEVEAGEIPYAPSRVSLVKQQWFWESIQIEACADEQLYQAKVRLRGGEGGNLEGVMNL